MNTEGKTKGELLAMAGILEWVAQQERTSYEADENSGRMYAEYAAELPGEYRNQVTECAWDAWQAGAAWAARECVSIIDAWSKVDDASQAMQANIRGAFPDAFKERSNG